MKLAQGILLSTALAASTAIAAIPSRETMAKLPVELVQGQVRYVTGGIGHDEALAFERAEHRYPLALEFAIKSKPHNEFTADVKVVIRDAKGATVLDTVSDGPFLLAKLPEGKYEIKATQDGKTLHREVTVIAGKPTHVGFLWASA